MKKRCEVDVRLRKSPVRWRKLPSWVRERLHQGTLRVERLREDIAHHAGVPSMPPVEIFPEIWTTGTNLIQGLSGVTGCGVETCIGVRLPAQTVVQPDDEILRAVLVHEFNHCFSGMVRIAEAQLLGRSLSEVEFPDGFTHAGEEAALLDPSEWFGPEDARKFIRWHDGSFDALEPVAMRLAEVLPVVAPEAGFWLKRRDIPTWVLERVRSRVRPTGAAEADRGGA